MYNGRVLGLPGQHDTRTDLSKMLRMDGEVTEAQSATGLTVLNVREAARTDPPLAAQEIALTVDPSRGWSVVEYVLETREGPVAYKVVGTSVPKRFGNVWYPESFRREVWRDGNFYWAEEFRVVSAEFNQRLDPGVFDLSSTDIWPGADIWNHVLGQPPHYRWDGHKAVPSGTPPQRGAMGGSLPIGLGPLAVILGSFGALVLFLRRGAGR
jgi:hypothetical protein